jgi:hypothetical protein
MGGSTRSGAKEREGLLLRKARDAWEERAGISRSAHGSFMLVDRDGFTGAEASRRTLSGSLEAFDLLLKRLDRVPRLETSSHDTEIEFLHEDEFLIHL